MARRTRLPEKTTKVAPAPVFKVSKGVRLTVEKVLRPNENYKIIGDNVVVTYYKS